MACVLNSSNRYSGWHFTNEREVIISGLPELFQLKIQFTHSFHAYENILN